MAGAETDRVHGDQAAREAGAEHVDFAVNVNPLGPMPQVLQAVRSADVTRYPEPTGLPAREALGAHLGVSAARLALGHGAAELLWTLARLWVRRGERVLVSGPAFSELRLAAVACEGVAVEVRAEPPHLLPDLDELDAAVAQQRPRLVYVANPANPSGRSVATEALAALAARHPAIMFVWDEAFLSLSTRHEERASSVPPNVVRVRSLTKDHALPGVRVGYLVADPGVVATLERARPPWMPSAHAQAAVIAVSSPAADSYVDACRTQLLAWRKQLDVELRGRGFGVVPSDTLFSLVHVGDGAAAQRALVRHGVVVRDATSFALPAYVRICARPPADLARLVTALEAVRT